MLEKSVLIPDYLTPSTSSPFAAVVVSILIIAALLWTLAPRATSQRFSLTRKCGIAAAFFVLALSASVTFAAEPETVSAVWPSANDYPTCSGAAFSCNRTCSGGSSNYSWSVGSGSVAVAYPQPSPSSPKPYGKAVYGWSDQNTYTSCFVYPDKPYCPSGYEWAGGDLCRKQSPCASKGGQPVDDGSLDFGDGSNQKLSMSFTTRSDDNYVGQTFCSGGCLAAVDKEVGGAGGTFEGKYYGQFSAKFSGQGCAPASPQVSPKTTPALIPKTTPEYDCLAKGMAYGYVNETVKCVPKTTTKETEKKTSETIKADGSKTKETRSDNTVCAAGVCTTTTTIITTEYNSSGTETGTSTKTESSSKPDPNSGLGTGGAGTSKDGMACGGPGQPVCAVKVDEAGTPSDLAGINANKGAFESAMDQWATKFSEVASPKQWGVVWNYQLPQGACTALQFGVRQFTASLDICKPLGYVRDLWQYVMCFLTGLYIWRSCRDALNIT